MSVARVALAVLAVLACVLAPRREAEACATAYPAAASVHVAEETALIVWDAAKKVQHFVRRATFRTEAKDFGFLVPTPSKPELAEAPDDVFDTMHAAMLPEVRRERPLVQPVLSCMYFARSGAAPAAQAKAAATGAAVRVLGEQTVAGLDAVILEADDAGALTEWLKRNGYVDRPALKSWLEPYVARKWKVTAFRFAKDAAATATLDTSAVRMSFPAEAPIFPYREPADAADPSHGPRLLRVFFVGDGRAGGALEEGAAWPGVATWASPTEVAADVARRAGAPLSGGPLWLTVLEDPSTKRPEGGDVVFRTDAAGARILPPPVIIREAAWLTVPVDLVVIAGLCIYGVVRLLRRRRRAT